MNPIARWVSLIAAVAIFCAAFAAVAQTTHRVGVLVPQPLPRGWEGEAFRDALRGLGHREGSNLILDIRTADGKLDQLPAIAADLVKSGAQLIVALNTPGTRAAMGATKTIPIVMAEVGDPIATGFVTNFARPGGNVTGVTNLCGELAGKRLSMLREALPSAKRIAVMLNPDDPITAPQVKDAERTAPTIGVEVRFFRVRAMPELEPALDEARAWKADAAMWLCGQQGVLERRSAALTAQHRLPVMTFRDDGLASGALLNYAPNRADSIRLAAAYVDRILKGAKPGDLPVVQPTKIHMIVNLKTARALGITIPQSVLLRADQVVE
jgi:putative ABC transport system substrate-binding protein